MLVLFFLGFLVFMAGKRNDENWERLTYLYVGLEAVVFAGAGALFGTTVTRQVASTANNQAKAAQQTADRERARADAATTQATQGAALAAVAKAKRNRRATGRETTRNLDPNDQSSWTEPAGDVHELADLADHFFPSA